MSRLKTYASFVRVSHSVFALPFALTGALLALHRLGDWTAASIGWRLFWIVAAMVTARSAAMGFNRWWMRGSTRSIRARPRASFHAAP